ncbi:O-methylsterigmatocystin oxidoreductase-2 [Coleophoma cylindrospora]|uniref:O-methylsterigmatocystin oxidoreductase-2 n=1 Tax=Coleophoma cylindrospora TaxID=1849047 RepID=A0A3D8QP14_9HELO|nr:O-methylsterigmatocystin oxidoreductase-2 [Coleophoma cylindrospora]
MASMLLVETSLLLLALYIFKSVFFDKKKKNAALLPPGPSGLPFVGNIADLPPAGIPEYQHWLKHKDLYGPISSVTVLGQTMIIIHDKDLALELMEKRSAIYSSRPRMVFAFEMCGWINTISSQPNNSRHRLYRKYAHQTIGTKAAVSQLSEIQEAEVGRFLQRLKQTPDKLVAHIRTEAGAIILKITYDYNIEQHKEDPLVKIADTALDQFSAAVVPGAWIVDVLPFLRHLPEWLPGAGFKRTSRLWKKTITDVADIPYNYVKRQISNQSNHDSYVSRLVEQNSSTLGPEEEHAIKWSAASLYTGGADTSVSTMGSFFLAMSITPEVQRKAQEEIDRVVGSSRLPTFSDRENLPYVDAIVKEALRWHPIGPMGLPHVVDQDDMCNGYLIPKGSLILPAIWWFTHDPKTYHDPMAFKPERYFEPFSEPSPNDVVWGFGRRICPGRVLADSNIYLAFAQTLAAFKIQKAVDEKGAEIQPEIGFTAGIISHPMPFKCRISPRSNAHEKLIDEIEERYPWTESDAQRL